MAHEKMTKEKIVNAKFSGCWCSLHYTNRYTITTYNAQPSDKLLYHRTANRRRRCSFSQGNFIGQIYVHSFPINIEQWLRAYDVSSTSNALEMQIHRYVVRTSYAIPITFMQIKISHCVIASRCSQIFSFVSFHIGRKSERNIYFPSETRHMKNDSIICYFYYCSASRCVY